MRPKISPPEQPPAPAYAPIPPYIPPEAEPPTEPAPAGRGCWQTALRAALTGFLATFIVVLIILAAFMVAYVYIAVNLPAPEELSGRSATFLSTKIYDRNGEVLYEVFDPHAGRRTLVPLSRISPYVIQATVATEDANFYSHPGIDPVGLARAIVRDLRAGELVIGGSTIPQQLVKLVFLSPERTPARKIKEAVLAAEITRRYSKDQILEIYLNEIFYGNLAYGIEAAAQAYFGKPAADLTLAEAALLAGIPQAPAVDDPFTNPDEARWRRSQVLRLMVQNGYITQAQAEAAEREPLPKTLQPFDIRAPHFVMFVRQQLEERYGPEVLYKAGLQVHTTLDYHLQELAEKTVRNQVLSLKDRNATNGALIALRPATGEILAMVGSRGFFDPQIDGQVNVTMRPRQPGSAIKPLTYLAAFEKGWTPATLLWDLPTEFPDGANPPYKPVNYDGKFHGPVLLRQALGNSYNIPAVKALQFVGLPSLLDMARRLGITTLTRSDYGLSLTLGGGDVTLLELTSAYATIANGGLRMPPVAILSVEDSSGRVIEKYEARQGQPVISPQHAYLMTNILSDNAARQPSFGLNSPLKLSRPAAVKTGTTNDYRDNWTIGYTPSLAVGVWVGNNDNSAMRGMTGVTGAAPIWHDFMEAALAGQKVEDFVRPQGIQEIEICADSGTRPSEACPARKRELFAANQGPLGPEADIHQMIAIDTSTNQLATEFCPPELVQKRPFEVYPPEALEWARANNRPIAPTVTCTVHGPDARVEIFEPKPEQTVSGQVPIFGVVKLPNLAQFVVEYGEGPAPIGWGHVAGPFNAPAEGGMLAMWDTRPLKNMDYSLRIVATDKDGHTREARVHVIVNNILPSPTPAPSLTPTRLTSPTATPTLAVSATPTSRPTATPTPPAQPSVTATSTPAPATPTAGPVTALISAPAENAIVAGIVTVQGSASAAGFTGYKLAYGAGFDPAQWVTILESAKPVDGALGQWDTRSLADGLYALRLTVLGAAGNRKEVTVHVTTDNTPPKVKITAPKAGESAPAGAPLTISIEADDNLGVAQVELYLDGKLVATLSAQPYTWSWPAPAAGSHRLQARAFDLAGNVATSPEVAFSIK